jgi:hypothetical protein
MEKQSKRVVKYFAVWQENQELFWLNDMAMQGWILQTKRGWNYNFVASSPSDVIFHKDYQVFRHPLDEDEYLELFHAAGWILVDKHHGWFYFICDRVNPYGRVYSDQQSKIYRFRDLVIVRILAFVLMMNGMLLLSQVDSTESVGYLPLFGIISVSVIGLSFDLFMLVKYMMSVKQSNARSGD